MKEFKYSTLLFILFLFSACATYELQISEDQKTIKFNNNREIAHSFYLIGDAGNSTLTKDSPALTYLKKHIKGASEKSTLLFLGDNVYETGIPKKSSRKYPLAKRRIEAQIEVAKSFEGNSIFIPGNHDWYNGLDGLKREEKLVEDALIKDAFLPNNGCPLEKVSISDDIELIIVDTHWYLTNWNNHPTINDECEIKTRDKFFEEFEGLIKKARGKTTIVALHHPMFTYGSHGGKFSFKSHMTPLPIVGTIKNVIRQTSGFTNTDIQNKKYNELKKRIVTLSQENEKTIFVSGHDHNLQYIVQDNLPQIVSGSGSKTKATKLAGSAKFTYSAQGFAKLNIYKDGSSKVSFYAVNDDKIVYETEVLKADITNNNQDYTEFKEKTKVASIYTEEEIKKTGFYQFLWGERYRKYFGTKIKAPTVQLDTLFGGLKPVRKGGGHQSKSLRLEDKNGSEYVMRALRKNATQYLQSVAFKEQYIEGQFSDTSTEALLSDVFTGSHPYAPFTIAKLSDAVGIYHSVPVLYYVPKQNTLGQFNEGFGDELYMIEERSASGHGDKKNFGFSDEIISTDDLLKKLDKNENHILDEEAYIRARLFDMLIGDWDRHEDQWRWAEFKKGDQTIYRPVPRDRDQAFSIFGDGFLLNAATTLIPTLRLMKSYSDDLKNTKWFNLEPYPLDMAIITKSNKSVWDEQVQLIKNNLTNAVIEDAFNNIPEEVNDETIADIKRKLIGRRENLQSISDSYFYHINKFQVVKGTQKDDWFDVERLPNGQTKITVFTIKKGVKNKISHQRTYNKDETKEIWIYGLDDDDHFIVKGDGENLIKIRIIGGQNNDIYEITNSKRIKVYDYRSKKNTFLTKNVSKKLTDNYETNVYDYTKIKDNENLLIPTVGFNPDDGVKLGVSNVYTAYGFERNPFTSQHTLGASYFFATGGFEINYSSEFANIFKTWNLGINAMFTSPKFSINYFGLGNNSINPEANDFKDLDYNRIRIKKLFGGTYIHWQGELGAKVKIGANLQNIKVENTLNRFLYTQFNENDPIFNNQQFINGEASYQYENYDNKTFPTMGIKTSLQLGHTSNLGNNNDFTYFIPQISFDYKLIASGNLVLATKVKSHFNFGDDYEFYQAATIGGNDGLRGFRNQRFTGKNSFYHSSDIRWNLNKVKTGLAPLSIGVYAGFDYGKVWGEENIIINPTLSYKNWNNSYGGGLFLNVADILAANIGAFNSTDGLRIAFKLGFDF
ncbi:metallophosphoesterase [Polaribacter sp. Asnod1-A03]|uniref:metallophosphoesterase n=1 Tax=Polaribacter sp. Asnod1-A03 TaxID=3160581 RepID=UPI00386EA2D1